MILEQGQLYHIYNQGNNRQGIYHCRENYPFFLEKNRRHVLPYADILVWCLMPNHFHLMVYVNHLELPMVDRSMKGNPSLGETSSRTRTIATITNTKSSHLSIGVMVSSFTRLVDIQNEISVSLFRQETRASCLTRMDKFFKAWYQPQVITQINTDYPKLQYPNICFNYINSNPIKDGIVRRNKEWGFLSYPYIYYWVT